MPVPSLQLNPYISHFYHHKRRYKTLYGGRGSGKSMGIGHCFILYSTQGQKLACFREYQNKITDSVYSLINEEIERLKIPGFRVFADRIEHKSGGLFKFHGMARDPDGIQSMQGFDKAWIEEAQVISQRSLLKLTPTFRKKGSEIWMGGNPQRRADIFSQRFIEPKLAFSLYEKIKYDDANMKCSLNYQDNPWYWDSDLDIERRQAFKTLDRATYDHVWNGAYNDSVPNSIILSEWFDAAVDAHKKMGNKWGKHGKIVVTHDPADSADARATMVTHGNIVLKIREDYENDINSAMAAACELARDYRADVFIYDADGCGLGLRSQVYDYFEFNNHITISEFRGGAIPDEAEEMAMEVNGRPITNRQFYSNLRSQKYHDLSERFRKTYHAVVLGQYIDPHELISIDSDAGQIDELKSELTSIPRKFNSSGTYQVMPKSDMLKLLKVKSPNLSDCAMMRELKLEFYNEPGQRIYAPTHSIA